MRNTHTTTGSNVEACELAVRANDRDETDVIGEDIDVIRRWYGNSDLELRQASASLLIDNEIKSMNLARQVELAVERLMVLQCFTGNKLLVEPDLVVGRSAREQVLARRLCERIHLVMQLRELRDRRDKDVAVVSSVTAQKLRRETMLTG